MERFLERLSVSEYHDSFIIKGGVLVTAMVGITMRSTMDLDASVRGITLTCKELECIVKEICAIDIHDGVSFAIRSLTEIMDEAEYPGIRIGMTGFYDGIRIPMKLDVSTGDIITPGAIVFEYQLLLENRRIHVLAYNLETVLAEKMETIITRSAANTKMRDFYDVYILCKLYRDRIDYTIMKEALMATAAKRGSSAVMADAENVFETLLLDFRMESLWRRYQKIIGMQRNWIGPMW